MFSKIPIYGPLAASSGASIREGMAELATTTIFSIFPLWFYPIAAKVIYDDPLLSNMLSFVSSGELFLYSAAIVGPLIFLITKKYGEFEGPEGNNDGFPRRLTIQFPSGYSFLVSSILICIFSAFLYGTIRTDADVSGTSLDDPSTKNLFWTSAIIYIFSLSCLFCATVYRINLENTPNRFGKDTRRLIEDWENRDD
ncbi:hypothetical protein [Pseudooceanicola nanhaiensis]|jgi:hypothetical protein|uniref:hypothetical protein n=1 Tax=Pseudooceanicola nanhaiensis TaxID=375761 RepID=UPI0012EC3440|nr:hypothetical protein [Pseudooceanicola nanhaiensis]